MSAQGRFIWLCIGMCSAYIFNTNTRRKPQTQSSSGCQWLWFSRTMKGLHLSNRQGPRENREDEKNMEYLKIYIITCKNRIHTGICTLFWCEYTKHTHTHTHTHTYIHVHTHTHIYTHIYTHTHTYTHLHTHTSHFHTILFFWVTWPCSCDLICLYSIYLSVP